MTINNTDSKYIKFLDCNSGTSKNIIFQSCNISIKEGSSILTQIPLCDMKLESLNGNSDLGGCGGSLNKKVNILSKKNYILTAPEIGQAQGEVQMIIVKVKYDKDQDISDRYLTWEYKGNIYPIYTLMILTGRTEQDIAWQGWDLSYYDVPIVSPAIFSPAIEQDLDFGGILFNNPSDYNVELEIFLFN